MKLLEKSIEKNANSTGIHLFEQIKAGHRTVTNKRTKEQQQDNIYIYRRTSITGEQAGKVFGYEVIIPRVKKAGTYNFPNGKTITYPEDFEEYPGASLFGITAWFCSDEANAELVFERELKGGNQEFLEEDDKPMKLPEGKFTVKEVEKLNETYYVKAYNFVRKKVKAGHLKIVGERAENKSRRASNLYAKA